MTEEEQQLTESWKDKVYEYKLTNKMMKTGDILTLYNTMPTYENLRQTLLVLKSFVYTMIYSNYYLKKFQNIVKPKIDDLEIILFGDPESKTTFEKCKEYDVFLNVQQRGNMRRISIENGFRLMKIMWEIFFLVKQWGYDMGLFLQKPFEKRYGLDAIEEAMET